jgi:integrase
MEYNMGKYTGITTKQLQNGQKVIMVRFKYLGKVYSVKNFTKLFACKTESQAFNKLHEVKVMISQGQDPFSQTENNLNGYFYDKLKNNVKNEIWREDTTAYNYRIYYENHIKNTIGHKKLNKITYSDLDNIIQNLLTNTGPSKNILKKILNPIMNDALKRGEINSNPALLLPHYKISKKEKLTYRTDEDSLTIARKLYSGISNYKPIAKLSPELNILMYLFILTSHRYSELLKLTKDDVYIVKKLIISPSSITKTKEDYHFPIPDECIEYIESIESGLLFPNLKYNAFRDYFKKLTKISNINTFKDKTISAHDTRRLMLNIMIRHCKIDSMLADTCLDHKQSGVVEHYLDFTYQDKKEAFQKYWDIVRS